VCVWSVSLLLIGCQEVALDQAMMCVCVVCELVADWLSGGGT